MLVDILFRQVATFINVQVSFLFGLQTLQLIDFSKIFQLKGQKSMVYLTPIFIRRCKSSILKQPLKNNSFKGKELTKTHFGFDHLIMKKLLKTTIEIKNHPMEMTLKMKNQQKTKRKLIYLLPASFQNLLTMLQFRIFFKESLMIFQVNQMVIVFNILIAMKAQ